MSEHPPESGFAELEWLLRHRRDVRHFRTDPVPEALIERALSLAVLAPSVGYSQPWRWVRVVDRDRRTAVIASHEEANARALAGAHVERGDEYAALKLSGLREAPVHLAVFCETAPVTGAGLGRQTMPQTLAYSVVMAVYGFWLAARALGLGVGWISILDPDDVTRALDVPPSWELIAYLAVGYPAFESTVPELAARGWEHLDRDAAKPIFR